MPDVLDYKLLHAESAAKLSAMVREHLTDGWRPLGGIGVAFGPMGRELYQAMILEAQAQAKIRTYPTPPDL